MIHLLTPQEPESGSAFLQSVQPSAPPAMEETKTAVGEFVQGNRSAIGWLMSLPAGAVESFAYLSGNLLAIPSIITLRFGKIMSSIRAGIFNVVAGKGGGAAPAPAH